MSQRTQIKEIKSCKYKHYCNKCKEIVEIELLYISIEWISIYRCKKCHSENLNLVSRQEKITIIRLNN